MWLVIERLQDPSSTVCNQPNHEADLGPEHASLPFQQLVPVPHKVRSTCTKKRRVGYAQCLASSPYKRSLEEALSPTPSTSRAKRCAENKPKLPPKKNAKRLPEAVTVAEVDTTPCLFCRIPYNEPHIQPYMSVLGWWQCTICSAWACKDCACVGKKTENVYLLNVLLKPSNKNLANCRPEFYFEFKLFSVFNVS